MGREDPTTLPPGLQLLPQHPPLRGRDGLRHTWRWSRQIKILSSDICCFAFFGHYNLSKIAAAHRSLPRSCSFQELFQPHGLVLWLKHMARRPKPPPTPKEKEGKAAKQPCFLEFKSSKQKSGLKLCNWFFCCCHPFLLHLLFIAPQNHCRLSKSACPPPLAADWTTQRMQTLWSRF